MIMYAEGSSGGNGNGNGNISPPLQSLSELGVSQSIPELKAEERGLYLIQLLVLCAKHVSAGNMEQTNMCMEQISHLACLTGDPMQRLATYFMEALASRITKAWRGLHRALNSTQLPSIAELLSARQVFYNLFPYLRFALDAVNLMILEAMQGEKVVHVIDLDASEPAQWMDLLRLLHRRQGGPPHLKITGIHDKREVLQQAAARLTEEAERLDIPFQFIPLLTRLEHLTDDMLKVKTGEAVAVSSVLQLHPLLAEDDCPGAGGRSPQPQSVSPPPPPPALSRFNGKRPRDTDLLRSMFTRYRSPSPSPSPSPDGTLAEFLERERSEKPKGVMKSIRSQGNVGRFLRVMRAVSPKVMVVVEQESNHNGGRLEERLMEALFYYGAMFDCLDSALPQQCMERVTLEKHMFGQQIENIVACEGAERLERHEKLDRWIKRLHCAGFALLPLTYATLMHAHRLVHSFSSHAYRLLDDKGCLTICWQEQPLYTVSAWQS